MELPIHIPKHPVASLLSWLLLTFLVLFPKGGIKVGETPITWGYLILALTAFPLLLIRLLAFPLKFSRKTLIALATIIPFQILFLYSCLQNGIGDIPLAVSTFISFFILPFLFLFVYPPFLCLIDGRKFERYLRICISVAAIYGIFLFFWHPITGHFIEIPYLTVNAGDYGMLETTKHIDRGTFFKLISTYNNGNIYGAATLILLPLYDVFEPKRWKRNLLRVALVLTLSRTVWFGLIVDQLLSFIAPFAGMLSTFPKIHLGPSMKKALTLIATVGLIAFGLVINSSSLSFLFDPTLGGRAGESAAFFHPTFLPDSPVGGFLEMVYSSAITDYGITGFISIVLIFLGPMIVLVMNPGAIRSVVRRAAIKGLIIYALIAAIDGAISLIPVMAFYWFAYMVFLFGFPDNVNPDISRLDVVPVTWKPNERLSFDSPGGAPGSAKVY